MQTMRTLTLLALVASAATLLALAGGASAHRGNRHMGEKYELPPNVYDEEVCGHLKEDQASESACIACCRDKDFDSCAYKSRGGPCVCVIITWRRLAAERKE